MRRCVATVLLCALLEFVARRVAMVRGFPFSAGPSVNPGVAFGLLRGTPAWAAVLSALGLAVILGSLFLLRRRNGALRLGLSVMAGGALANLAERMARGFVTDWLPLPLSDAFIEGGLNFNLADVEIVLGASVALWAVAFGGEADEMDETDKMDQKGA